MTPAFVPAARSPDHHGSSTWLMSDTGAHRRGDATAARFRRTLHTIATFAGRVLFARRLHDGHRLALCEIDEADLSELGRQARREALYEIRELERQARRKARP